MAKLSESFTTTEIGNFQDFTQQDPLGVGFSNAITIKWGPGGNTSDNAITVGSDGILTVNDSTNEIELDFTVRISRFTGAGVAKPLLWYEASFDGGASWSAAGNSIDAVLSSTDVAIRDTGVVFIPRGTAIGFKLRGRIARYDGSNNSGSLIPIIMSGTFAGNVNDTSSASLVIRKIEAL